MFHVQEPSYMVVVLSALWGVTAKSGVSVRRVQKLFETANKGVYPLISDDASA